MEHTYLQDSQGFPNLQFLIFYWFLLSLNALQSKRTVNDICLAFPNFFMQTYILQNVYFVSPFTWYGQWVGQKTWQNNSSFSISQTHLFMWSEHFLKHLLIYVVLCSSDIPVGKHMGIPGIIIFFSSLCHRLLFLFFLSDWPYTQNNFSLKGVIRENVFRHVKGVGGLTSPSVVVWMFSILMAYLFIDFLVTTE